MIAHRYKNGNITLKAEQEDIEDEHESMLVHVLWALGDLDCDIFGEEYCMGNALGMAVDVYCAYNDKLLCIPYALLDDLEAGKTVRLYARNLTEWDREEYEKLVAADEL